MASMLPPRWAGQSKMMTVAPTGTASIGVGMDDIGSMIVEKPNEMNLSKILEEFRSKPDKIKQETLEVYKRIIHEHDVKKRTILLNDPDFKEVSRQMEDINNAILKQMETLRLLEQSRDSIIDEVANKYDSENPLPFSVTEYQSLEKRTMEDLRNILRTNKPVFRKA